MSNKIEDNNLLDGIVTYIRDEINMRVRSSAEKIVAEVILEVTNNLKVNMYNKPENRSLNIEFTFEGGRE